MLLNEDFLQYVWKFRLFDLNNLRTAGGETIEIISAGFQNSHAGPDFYDAKIKIGDTVWAGNVEIHTSSSEWKKHNHHTDKAYENVILHVVYRDDQPVYRADGSCLACLELAGRIDVELYNRYHRLVFDEKQFIPCETAIGKIERPTVDSWLTRVLIERLQSKSATLAVALKANCGDWEETFYQYLAANFGFKTNALPFELLAKSMPQLILAKHKNNPTQIEALIFGQAGFLQDDFTDTYPASLKSEYDFMKHKYSLEPIEKHLWKFLRMRPVNFPTIRLAQFAALVTRSNHLFSKALETTDAAGLRNLFTDIDVHPYWDNHYRFDKESKPSSKKLGKSSVDILLLNTIVLFLFSYGHQHKLEPFVNRSLALLEMLPAEQNGIIENFDAQGVSVNDAYGSQALLELKKSYCSKKQCLQCGIGVKVLKIN